MGARGDPGEHTRGVEARLIEAIGRVRRTRDINTIAAESMTVGQRVADAVASLIGSWRFIIVQSILFAIWIVLNVYELLWRPWDPYPFILLNLVLSFQAAYSGPIIMMSQNRQAAKDRIQAELDLRTDVKAEMLIEELHGHVEELRIERWRELLEIQQRQIELLQQLLEREGGRGRGSGIGGGRPRRRAPTAAGRDAATGLASRRLAPRLD